MLSRLSENVVRVFEELEYRVDEDGFVYRPNGSIVHVVIRQSQKGLPYYYFNIRFRESRDSRPVAVHKLTAYQKYGLEAFQPDVVVRHWNGDSLDNSPRNIKIGSLSDNQLDIPENIRLSRSRHAASFQRSITSDEARLIRETKPPLSEVMARFGVSKSTASYIRSGRTYKD